MLRLDLSVLSTILFIEIPFGGQESPFWARYLFLFGRPAEPN